MVGLIDECFLGVKPIVGADSGVEIRGSTDLCQAKICSVHPSESARVLQVLSLDLTGIDAMTSRDALTLLASKALFSGGRLIDVRHPDRGRWKCLDHSDDL